MQVILQEVLYAVLIAAKKLAAKSAGLIYERRFFWNTILD
jgi:hypothetical protein